MKVLITSTVNPKAMLNWNLRLPPYISLDLDSDLKLNSNLDYLDLYLDLNTNPNTDIKLDIKTNLDFSLDIKSDIELDVDLDSEAEEILKDITIYFIACKVYIIYTNSFLIALH